MPEFLPSESDDAVFRKPARLGPFVAVPPGIDEVQEMTKKDWEEVAQAERVAEDEYNFAEKAEDVAKKRGLVVVYPKPNQIQIDLDTDEQYKAFSDNYTNLFDENMDGRFLTVEDLKINPSASGLPHRHIYITLNTELTEWQRICLQAVLGSDPKRELLNVKRMLYGVENPTRLFEKPETAKMLK